MNNKNKIDVKVPDKYLKCNLYNPTDDLFVGAIKSLRDQGRVCEFLGFNVWNGHVVLISGIKYYTSGKSACNMEGVSYETFFVVVNEEYDFVENRFKDRVNKIIDIL